MNERAGEEYKDLNYESYPVNVVTLPIGWLFYRDSEYRGLEFLKSLIHKDDVQVFNIKTIEMIVELLFTNFKSYIYQG